MKHDIFISYSRKDKDIVLPYVEQINDALGRDCWLDLHGIESGVEFEDIIIKAIDECQVVLFMLSDSSLASKWTKREVYYAESGGKRIVPILVDGEQLRGWFNFHFGSVDFINIRSEEHKEKLVQNLRNWLGVKEEKQRTQEWIQYHNSITHRSDYPRQLHQLIDNMVLVEGGVFQMGVPKEYKDEYDGLTCPFEYSLPRHHVTVEPFYIGKYPVTQEEWECVTGNNPSKFTQKKDSFPIDGIFWGDCQEFVSRLNNLTGEQFRLPTEAEWEFAARGGNVGHTNNYFYAGSNDINAVAWHSGNSNRRTHEVGLKKPNELGLYDMSGNVEEWCSDLYDNYPSSYYSQVFNHNKASYRHDHVLRGGGWMGDKISCSIYYRSSTYLRDLDPENWGFRLAMDYNGFI